MTSTVDKEPTRFVVGSGERFRHWCRENGVNPHRPSADGVVQITRVEHVKGHDFKPENPVVYLNSSNVERGVFEAIKDRQARWLG